MRSLVVDDELVSRKKMQRIMDSFGECRAVDNGMAAINAVISSWKDNEPFEVITLDISMPDMTGIEVLGKIRLLEKKRSDPKQARLRIIMVTSHSDKENVVNALKAGCDDYVAKPFDKKIMAGKLKKLNFQVAPDE